MFDDAYLDYSATVVFPAKPGGAICPGCGCRLYFTDDGAVGRNTADDWEPGGIQSWHPSRGTGSPGR